MFQIFDALLFLLLALIIFKDQRWQLSLNCSIHRHLGFAHLHNVVVVVRVLVGDGCFDAKRDSLYHECFKATWLCFTFNAKRLQ